jgi:hypothetical protein
VERFEKILAIDHAMQAINPIRRREKRADKLLLAFDRMNRLRHR